MKKKVDPRIRQVLQDAVSNNHRAMLVLVGDKSRDQVVNLHYMLSKMTLTSRPNVLWCYKKELGFSCSKRKRMKVIKKRMKQGLVDTSKDDPFELFISSTSIRFAYYSESQKILGNTYGMCVLQDFEALTPNLLARTMETVQGGGLIVLLINNMSSLKQLFSLSMDVHLRLRTEAYSNVVPRFNERFILSISDCPAAIISDDELNVLPISSHVRSLTGSAMPTTVNKEAGLKAGSATDAAELSELKKSLEETYPIGNLIGKSKTVDQAKALLRFEEALSDKSLRTTVALTASRGRGKSAALGLAVAAAVAHEYSNIFVTSPSPENLRTFFAFLFVGFDALGMQEHTDYEAIQSAQDNNVVVRVNIFKSHRQTVQYISPSDTMSSNILSQAELLIIDEAAAIPLPIVENMLGPYVVFISSTVTGYEGTGRSLSLKLLKKLKDNSPSSSAANASSASVPQTKAITSNAGRIFYQVEMKLPIRYANHDPIEHWLYDLLCLNVNETRQTLLKGAPYPSDCQLFYVERDALFSRHKASELFLKKIVALFVASHYKNSPNDLQMLSDAPAHALFVLLAPTDADTADLPDVLVAIQVCLEGRLSHATASHGLSTANRASGDLIPWTIAQQFQEPGFTQLAGVRIVRIATHPDLHKMGYGSRAIQLLTDYYGGKFAVSLDLDEKMPSADKESHAGSSDDEDGDGKGLLNEVVGPRKNIPPLLRRLAERKPERLDYVGVSFGLTDSLYNFWGSRLGFVPLYVRLTANELTGEHTCIMVRACRSDDDDEEDDVDDEKFSSSWMRDFHDDFRKRFVHLLGYELRKLSPKLATAILSASSASPPATDSSKGWAKAQLEQLLAHPYDMRRLESYARSLVDFHLILDLVPRLAELLLLGALPADLSPVQRTIVVSVGLQRSPVDAVAAALGIQVAQVLALLNKVVRKLAKALRDMAEARVRDEDAVDEHAILGRLPAAGVQKADDEDEKEEKEEKNENKEDDEEKDENEDEDEDEEDDEEKQVSKKVEVHHALEKYKVAGSDAEWKKALDGKNIPSTLSIKTKRKVEAEGVALNGSKPSRVLDGDGSTKKKKKRKLR